MNIILWWNQYSWGGVDTHLLSLIENWPDPDDKFYIFYNRGNKGFKRIRNKLTLIDNVVAIPFRQAIPSPKLIPQAISYIFFPFIFIIDILISIYQINLIRNPSVFLANNGSYPGSWNTLAAVYAATFLKIPTRILIVHHEANFRRIFLGTLEHIVDLTIQRVLNTIVCVSLATRATLIERRGFNPGTCPIRVIHNGISFTDQEIIPKVNIRSLSNARDHQKLIGIVGRLEPYKGHEDLIVALSMLEKSVIFDIHVLFIGKYSPHQLISLQSLAEHLNVQGSISFLGYIDDDSQIIIKQLDLMLMLTRDFEGFGLTVLEAMNSETPIIVTDVGAIREFVDLNNGYIIPPESPDSISLALEKFILDPEPFILKAKNAKIGLSKFDGKKMSSSFYRLIKSHAR